MTKPMLAAPDLNKEMRVETDALDYATGDVLSMKCEDYHEPPPQECN